MNKSGKQLLSLLLALVVLIGALFAVKSYNQSQVEKDQELEDITLTDTNKDDILRLTYDYEGETYTFEKVDDVWYYAKDHSLTITQYMITNMLNKLAPLTAKQAIEDVTDMSQYGLGDQARTICWETVDSTYILEVGNYNDISSVEYIRFPSETTVYTVPSSTVTAFDKNLEDVVEEPEETEEE